MADPHFIARSQQTGREIRWLTSMLPDAFTDEETSEIEEYLGVNEFGLAFEAIIDILSQKHYRPNKQAYALIELLGQKIHSKVADWRLILPPLETTEQPDS